ncbi:MAG TPA: pentapeptide repeat-containing protein, partial [Methanothrix soehngenii]|nr:pentapeptide repeat-containing protein [Methanothrix soehngenii]
ADVSFKEASFGGDANFGPYKSSQSIRAVKFNGTTNFEDAQFIQKADFEGADFGADVSFKEASFGGDANFGPYKSSQGILAVKFNGTAHFEDAQFIQRADFEYAQFSSSSNFTDCEFVGEANFKRSNFSSDPDFKGAEFKDRANIRWEHLQGELVYDDETFLLLIENYKNAGWFEDARDCYYRYRKERRENTEMSVLSRIEDVSFDLLYGYGTKPSRAVLSSAAVILLFGLLWFDLSPDQFGRKIKDQSPRKRGGADHPILKLIRALKFSATIFLSGTKLFVEPPESPQISGRLEPFSEALFILERVIGSFLFFLFIIAAGNTMIQWS